ncbi:hypothetical protein TDB9533_03471 [Thalassocella blandensis]|nr:hypothetical protein TDB9533_03471 [Thalassocella blandensis]
MQEVIHLSIYIARSVEDVYAYASNPLNLPAWAAGLARSEVKADGEYWIAEAPFGQAKIKFAPKNTLGVMDHEVLLENGVSVYNPMRAMPNGVGSEFTFSLFRQDGMSDSDYAADKRAVEKDLAKIKAILESKH